MPKDKSPKKLKAWSTEAAVNSALRRAFKMYPPYIQVLNNAKSEYFPLSKKGKPMRRVRFLCAHCNNTFPQYLMVTVKKGKNKGKKRKEKQIQVDHIISIMPTDGSTIDMNQKVVRMFCPLEGLAVLCLECHKAKSKVEAGLRAKARKDKK